MTRWPRRRAWSRSSASSTRGRERSPRLAGVVILALALGSLAVSYGHGLFGWHEGGFRTAIAIAVITETCAAILLSGALTTAAVRRHAH